MTMNYVSGDKSLDITGTHVHPRTTSRRRPPPPSVYKTRVAVLANERKRVNWKEY